MTRDTMRHHLEADLAHEGATKWNGALYLLHPVSPTFNIHAPVPPPPACAHHLSFVAFRTNFPRLAPDLCTAFAKCMTRQCLVPWAMVDRTHLLKFAFEAIEDLTTWQSDFDKGPECIGVTNVRANALHEHLKVAGE